MKVNCVKIIKNIDDICAKKQKKSFLTIFENIITNIITEIK